MSARSIPYHLRQNKAIDRNLFVELLSMVNRYFVVSKYEYISMGGPFLEDFKVIHSATGISRMISLEESDDVYRRQEFNRPLSCIKLVPENSSTFIGRYQFEKPTIIWLDFTSPTKLASNLGDVYEVTTKLKPKDILKITLNANASAILKERTPDDPEVLKRRLEELENEIGEFLPSDVDKTMVSNQAYPTLLFRVLELILDKAVGSNSPNYFQKLASYAYADGQTMLTFTGAILDRSETKNFMKETEIGKWSLGAVNRTDPVPIAVPELSIKERMYLDSLLPKFKAATLQKRLSYLIADSEILSTEGLENYVRYYKQFPYYSKVVV